MAANALAQDLSGWSDKTVCRLVETNGVAVYVEEASSRGLVCKAPIKPNLPNPSLRVLVELILMAVVAIY